MLFLKPHLHPPNPSHYIYLFLHCEEADVFVWFNWRLCLVFADDEDEYEEAGGGNRLLGFMFGNVDYSGDLDVDYLDEVICSFLFFSPFVIWLSNN